MLRQELIWELKNSTEWDKNDLLNEENLKKELEALNHFAHHKVLSGVKKLFEILMGNDWKYTEQGEEIKTVINFNSVKKIYERWEFIRQCCDHYHWYNVCEDESYLGCTTHDEGQRILFGHRGDSWNKPLLGCPYARSMAPGTKEVIGQHKCPDFKPMKELRPFMDIVAEVNHT